MRYAVVDLESTGPRVEEGDRIIQIGAVLVENGYKIAEYEMLINPNVSIPLNIQQLTGIQQEQVDKAPQFPAVAPLWFKRLENCVLVAHNLHHDLNFLKKEFELAGFAYQPTAIDSVKLAKILFPQASGFNLTDLSHYLHLPFNNAHQALADAEITSTIVDLMARKLLRLDPKVQQDLQSLSKYLSHQESLFFSQADTFVRQDIEALSCQFETIQPERVDDKHFQAQRDWLLKKSQDHQRAVIEGQWYPIPSSLSKAWILHNIGENWPILCLCLSNQQQLESYYHYFIQEDLRPHILLTESHYLNRALFEHYFNYVQGKPMNQQELIVLASSLVWLQETQTGLLFEMNHEIKITEQMKRYYQSVRRPYFDSYFYQLAIQTAQKSNLILTDPQFLMSLIRDGNQLETQTLKQRLQKAVLLIDNSSLFSRILSQSLQVKVSLSHFLITNQQALDLLYHADRRLEGVSCNITRLEQASTMLRHLISLFEVILDKTQDGSDQQMAFSQSYLEDEEAEPILQIGRSLVDTLEPFLNESANLLALTLQADVLHKKFQTISWQLTQIKAMLAKSVGSSGFQTIKASRIDERYYQLEWTWKPIQVQAVFQKITTLFDKSYLMSPGDLHPHQNQGVFYQLGLATYHRLQLPQIRQEIEMTVPFDYLAPIQGDRQEWEHQAELLKDYLADRIDTDSMPALSLVIVNNRDQAIQFYRSLKQLVNEQRDLRVLGQHSSGSLNKIRRLSLDSPVTLLVVQWQSLLNDHWTIDQRNCEVYWLRLPFRSLKDPSLIAMGKHLGMDTDHLFDQLLLPQMVTDFSITLDYLKNNFTIIDWKLLDDRVFTTYYSKEIRQRLEHLVSFILK